MSIKKNCIGNHAAALRRRDWLYGLGTTLGSVAFSAMMADEMQPGKSNASSHQGRHFPAKARNCIFLMMEGGPSHIDTFDPKPELKKQHLREFVRQGQMKSAMESGKRYYVQSPFTFRRCGDSGADMATNWQNLARVADEICFFRGCQVDSVNHPTAMYQINCGNRFGGDPALGAWVNYGLGSENRNIPGFMVLPEVSYPQGGAANWSNGYLPTVYQGTPLRPVGDPILDLQPGVKVSHQEQQDLLTLISSMDRAHATDHPENDTLAARMKNYELAFAMQAQVPDLLDISSESQATQQHYGIGRDATDSFGRKCLLARRLVEQGVRFVQLYHGTWDSHDYIQRAHGKLIEAVDQPITALIEDLRQRGLLESTLVVWCGEFGRTPDNGVRAGTAYGRDHNPNAMTVWMAGGGCRAGHTIGATDDLGMEAVEERHHVRDLHVTLLRLLGLDDNRLTFYHAGRFKQLSQFGGEIISKLIG